MLTVDEKCLQIRFIRLVSDFLCLNEHFPQRKFIVLFTFGKETCYIEDSHGYF